MDAWIAIASANDERQLEQLLAADPTLLDRVHPQHERTALQVAAAWDASRAVACLLAHGADLYASDPDGLTALHLAASSNCATTLELLLLHHQQQQQKPQRSSCKPAATTHPHAPRAAAAVAAFVSQRSRDGFSALLLAAALGHSECCSLLLSLGDADPLLALDSPPFSTALDLALLGQHERAVAVLRDYMEAAGE